MNRSCSSKKAFVVIVSICFALSLCMCKGFDPNSETINDSHIETIDDPLTSIADSDTLAKWEDWAMRSDEGQWENDPSHNIKLTLFQTYGGEDNPNPQFYSVKWFEVSGDTLFIADRVRECLVCMNSDGEVLWEYGEPGEGPGHFNYIGPIAVSDSWLAVCNIRGDRIELLTKNGEMIETYSILNPLFVEEISLDEFAVLSRVAPHGDIHLYNIDEGYLSSFGECPAPGGEFAQRSTGEYSAVSIDNRYLIVNDFFEYRFLLFDIREQELLAEFSRNHPSGNLPSNTITELEDGAMAGAFYFVLGKLFLGPEGAINVKLAAIQKDGSVISSRETIGSAPVTVIDRYNLAGEYLDSYCIPLPNCTEFRYSDPYLYVSQSYTGTVFQFKIE